MLVQLDLISSIGNQDPVSTYFDKTFDGAHNLTIQAGDLKHVRWARVDYLEVTEITTRWAIWKSVPCSSLSSSSQKCVAHFFSHFIV